MGERIGNEKKETGKGMERKEIKGEGKKGKEDIGWERGSSRG